MNKIILLLFFIAFTVAQNPSSKSSENTQTFEGLLIEEVDWTTVHLEGFWNISNTNCLDDVCYPDSIGVNTTVMPESYTNTISFSWHQTPVCANNSGIVTIFELKVQNTSLTDQEEKDLSNIISLDILNSLPAIDTVYFPQNDSVTYIYASDFGICTVNYQRLKNQTNLNQNL